MYARMHSLPPFFPPPHIRQHKQESVSLEDINFLTHFVSQRVQGAVHWSNFINDRRKDLQVKRTAPHCYHCAGNLFANFTGVFLWENMKSTQWNMVQLWIKTQSDSDKTRDPSAMKLLWTLFSSIKIFTQTTKLFSLNCKSNVRLLLKWEVVLDANLMSGYL